METIYISGHLKNTDRGKHIAKELHQIAQNSSYNFQIIEIPNPFHSKNEWCRDYMPLKGSDGQYKSFKYRPSYMMDYASYEKMIPDLVKLCKELKLSAEEQDIILDGGAIEILGGKGIISDKVLGENTSSWNNGKPEILEDIKQALKLDELIVVPADPWDFTGHVDGMIRFVDNNTVLVNDLTGLDNFMKEEPEYDQWTYNKWKGNLKNSLDHAGLKQIPLTCTTYNNPEDDWANGAYMNFLNLTGCIIMPTFDDPENDIKAQNILEQVYNRPVETIEAVELAKKGGVINCVTWNA